MHSGACSYFSRTRENFPGPEQVSTVNTLITSAAHPGRDAQPKILLGSRMGVWERRHNTFLLAAPLKAKRPLSDKGESWVPCLPENSRWHSPCIQRRIQNPPQPILFKEANHEADFPYASHLRGSLHQLTPHHAFAPVSLSRWNSRFSGNCSRTTPQNNDLPNNLLIPLLFREWGRMPESYVRVNEGQNCNLYLWPDRKVETEGMLLSASPPTHRSNLSLRMFCQDKAYILHDTSPI